MSDAEEGRLKGVRTVKEYPIDRDELFELGGVSLLATVSFSIGYANWQRSQDIQRDLELSQGLPDKLIARWTAKQEDAYEIALIFFAIGLAALIAGGLKLWGVIATTAHPDAEQKPPLKARLQALWSGTQPPPSTEEKKQP
jgi:hypothetical protein